MGKLENKVAVISGGASGIGKATVKLFVEEDAKVVFLDIQEDMGKILAEELGSNAIFFYGDVRNESDIKGVINLAVEKFGRLNCIFNNAGFPGANGYIEEIPTEAFDETIDVLFRSVFLGMKYSAPIMKKQGSGSIISTASATCICTGMGPHIYSAIKAAIIHLTHTVATELGTSNIRVNCICPGAITTPIFGRGLNLDQKASERLAQLLKMEFKNIQPIPRSGIPEDAANAVLWLASDDSSFVTSHALVFDGGISLGRTVEEFKNVFDEIVKTLKLGDLDEIIKSVNEKIINNKYY
jgi:NAD(P)-dependent dehydrogenase (short-subunit alcohol dehydrogenase family)